MKKKPKGRKPAATDKKGGLLKEHPSKTDSAPANPSAVEGEKAADTISPLSTTTSPGFDGTNVREEKAVSPGRALNTQGTALSMTATVIAEPSAKTKYSSISQPEPQGGRPAIDPAPALQPRIVKQLSRAATSPLLASPGSSCAAPSVAPSGGLSPLAAQGSGPQQRQQAPGARGGLFGADGRPKAKAPALVVASPATRAIREAATILTSPATHLSRAKHDAFKKKVAIAVTAAIVSGAIVLIAFAADVRFRMKGKIYCDSEDCLYHVDMLTSRLDKNIDPCEDFSAYVCSAWSPSAEYREHVKTPIDAMLYARFIGFRTILAGGTEKLPVGNKALAMYESCMSFRVTDVSNLDNFRRLMKALGLSWPEQPAENVSALGTMLVMAYKWQLPLWMSVTVPVTGDVTKWRLGIGPSHYITLLRNQYESVRSGGGYGEYWEGYYNTFRTNSTRPLDEPSIAAVADAEGVILENLKTSSISQEKIPAVIRLSSIGNYTAPLTSDAWLDQLNLSLELTPPVLPDHQITTSDARFLTRVGGLFANYSSQRLLSQLAWSFVQTYAPISSPHLLVVRFGDRWKADLYRPVFCAAHVEGSFKLLVVALDYVSRLSRQDLVSIGMGYSRLISALLIMLNSSTWLDLDSQKIAAKKVESMHTLAWPSQKWFARGVLEELYSDYPTKEETFGDYWISAHVAMAKQNRTDDFEAVQSLPSNVPPADFEYDYVLNRVEIPIGIVNKPLYYRSGTKAMFYGGLGFQMALEIVSALDKEGLHWNSDGEEVTTILSEASMKTFEAKDRCLVDEGIESIFPEVPALEIAYSAMMRSIQSDPEALPVKGLSEEEVFFMTICYMMCTSATTQHSYSACDKIVRNSPTFQKTFRCLNGAKMNPEKKCRFFSLCSLRTEALQVKYQHRVYFAGSREWPLSDCSFVPP